MSPDEQEVGSIRFIAPRVFRLTSGRLVLIDMMGNKGAQVFASDTDLLAAIPTYDQLCDEHDAITRRRVSARPTPSSRPIQTSLDDLA
jgi:hypothetical protein